MNTIRKRNDIERVPIFKLCERQLWADSVEKLTFVSVPDVELNSLYCLVTLGLGPTLQVCEGFGLLRPLGTHLLLRLVLVGEDGRVSGCA